MLLSLIKILACYKRLFLPVPSTDLFSRIPQDTLTGRNDEHAAISLLSIRTIASTTTVIVLLQHINLHEPDLTDNSTSLNLIPSW